MAAAIKIPSSKFLLVETEQIVKFVKELNDIKEGWEFRLINLEDRIKKLETCTLLKRKAGVKRA